MKKILIIEDDWMMIWILQNHFAEREVELLIASDAAEGLQKAQDEAPDLIILDVRIAGQSGIDILKKIKSSPETASIPVVILSAVDQEDVIAEARALGAADYIVKGSLPLEETLKRIKKHINT